MNQTTFVDPSSTVPAAGGGNVGNGTCSTPVVSSATLTENFTITCTVPGGSGVGQFSVVGSVSGNIGTATSNSEFIDANKKVRFTLTAGGTPWAVGDTFSFSTTAGTPINQANINTYSSPVAAQNEANVFTADQTITENAGGVAQLTINGTGANGANLKLVGNGGTTPSKTIRAFNGNIEVVNNAYSSAILRWDDTGKQNVGIVPLARMGTLVLSDTSDQSIADGASLIALLNDSTITRFFIWTVRATNSVVRLSGAVVRPDGTLETDYAYTYMQVDTVRYVLTINNPNPIAGNSPTVRRKIYELTES